MKPKLGLDCPVCSVKMKLIMKPMKHDDTMIFECEFCQGKFQVRLKAVQEVENHNKGSNTMTYRELAEKAMTELGFTESKIASILAYMDADGPQFIGKTETQVPPEMEQLALKTAKDYFRRNNTIPTNN